MYAAASFCWFKVISFINHAMLLQQWKSWQEITIKQQRTTFSPSGLAHFMTWHVAHPLCSQNLHSPWPFSLSMFSAHNSPGTLFSIRTLQIGASGSTGLNVHSSAIRTAVYVQVRWQGTDHRCSFLLTSGIFRDSGVEWSQHTAKPHSNESFSSRQHWN
jgi:hypothetical protein